MLGSSSLSKTKIKLQGVTAEIIPYPCAQMVSDGVTMPGSFPTQNRASHQFPRPHVIYKLGGATCPLKCSGRWTKARLPAAMSPSQACAGPVGTRR